jgi:hypothetical protein
LPSSSSSGAAEYSFKSSAFFGGKMNVRSSVVHVAHSTGVETASSAAPGREEAQELIAAVPRQQTLLAHYAVDAVRYVFISVSS